jgi:hypothetical protein
VLNTSALIASLNLTADQRDINIPQLNELLQLIQDIEDVLGRSMVEMLSSDIGGTHSAVCELLNRTRGLLRRGQILEEDLATSEMVSNTILSNLTAVMHTLSQLEFELDEISAFLNDVFVSNNSTEILESVRSALQRADISESVIMVNFTSALREVQSTLLEFNQRNASLAEERNEDLLTSIDIFQNSVYLLWALVNKAGAQLCGSLGGDGSGSGNGNGTCDDECGGVGCGMCGGDDEAAIGMCNGLSSRASEALNTSQRALEIANGLTLDVQARLDVLRELLQRAQYALLGSGLVEDGATELRRVVDELQLDIRSLLTELEAELGVVRIDPDEIGENIDATLEIQLDSSLEEVRIDMV